MRRTVEAEAGSIRLQRDNHKGSFLLVEGSSDKKFYTQFVDREACIVVSTSGKPSSKLRVIAVLSVLENSGFKGALAIVDKDFDDLVPVPISKSPNLFTTDDHDLEAMLIHSPAFNKVLNEFGSEQKLKRFGQDVVTIMLAASTTIGYLRWISQRDTLNLKFNGISFAKFIDSNSLEINEIAFIREIQNKSQIFSLATSEIQQLIDSEKSNSHDPWQLCCGHDLTEILSVGLKQILGSNRTTEIEAPKLERCLRLAYEKAYWLKTQLYSDIYDWEKANAPFSVF